MRGRTNDAPRFRGNPSGWGVIVCGALYGAQKTTKFKQYKHHHGKSGNLPNQTATGNE